VISLLMTESVNEEQILELATSSAPGLGSWQIDGYYFTDGQWLPSATGLASCPRVLAGQLAALGADSGRVDMPGRQWTWAYPLRGAGGLLGHLIASCDQEPSAEQRFMIQVLAQQTGVAVSNARLHARERSTAAALAAANTALAETVTNLQRSMDIHQRLTQVAVSGEGQPGIAKALHELTGMPVAIEDRYGNLTAWAGPGKPDPYPKEPFAKREQLLRRLMRASKPIRDGERLTLLASPRTDVIGVLALIDPEHTADKADLVARKLIGPDLFSGWGVRTLAASMVGYNPISYHCGSVWPHDNAVAAAGLMRYGYVREAQRVIMAVLDAAVAQGGRLPELYSGLERMELPLVVSYPTSCSPQAWAAASPLLMLHTLLRLDPWVPRGKVWLQPALPEQIGHLHVGRIPLAGARVSVTVDGGSVSVEGLPHDLELVDAPRHPLTGS